MIPACLALFEINKANALLGEGVDTTWESELSPPITMFPALS